MGGGGGTTVVQPPPAPNYQESMKSILEAQVAMAPQVYESEAKYQPLYNALQAAQQAFQVQQNLNVAKQAYPQIAEMEAAYNQANRQAELSQLQTALPEYQRAFNSLTPGYAQAVASTGQLAQSAMAQSLNRPQFSSFENAVRDPYGRPVADPQLQTFQFAPQQLNFQPQPQAFSQYQPSFAQPPQQAQPPASTGGLQLQGLGSPVSALTPSPGTLMGPMQGPLTQEQFNAQQAQKTQGGKGTPPPPQGPQGNFAGQMTQQLQKPPSPPLPPPSEQKGKGTPPPPQGPAGNFAGQMTNKLSGPPPPVSPLEQVPAGGYVAAVKDFIPSQRIGTSTDMMLTQSQRELAAGRKLTAEEQRMADQSVRAAYAARGTALGNQAIGAEILNRADVANQRYQQRLQNATNAAQVGMAQQELLQSAQAQRYQQAMGREELSAATQQSAFGQALARNQAQQQRYNAGTQAQAAQAALGASAMGQLQAAQAPVLQAFYKQPILQGQENQAQQMAMAMQQQAGPQYFNPESQTGMGSIYGAYNAQTQLAAANAQAAAGAKAGKMGMIGSLGGAALGAAAVF